MERKPTTPSVEVLAKAVHLIEFLAAAPSGLTLHEITVASGFAKTTAYRLLQTWDELGYVSRSSQSGRYQIGLAALELARKLSCRNRIVEASRELLLRAQQATGESAYLAVFRSGRVILIDGVEGAHPLRVVVDLGEQCYLHASAQGRSVAAYLHPESLMALLEASGMPQVTPDTKTSLAALHSRLHEARAKGYSLNWGETVPGAVCLGVPFFAGANGPVLGSLGLSIPTPRATEQHLEKCIHLLLEAGRNLSRVLVDMTAEPEARSAAFFAASPAVQNSTEAPLRPLSY